MISLKQLFIHILIVHYTISSESLKMINHFRDWFSDSYHSTYFNMSDTNDKNTKELIYNNYINKTSPDFRISMLKLLIDSAQSKYDIGTYSKCLYLDYFRKDLKDKTNNYTYYLVVKQKELDLFGKNQNLIFGLCWYKNIAIQPLKRFLYQVNIKWNNFFEWENEDDLSIIDMRLQEHLGINPKCLLHLIPGYILFLQILFMLFPFIPEKLFQCCFKNSNDVQTKLTRSSIESGINTVNNELLINQNNISDNENRNPQDDKKKSIDMNRVSDISINKKYMYYFKMCFSMSGNSEEWFTWKNDTHNEMGLSYIKGLRGTSLILYWFGTVFLVWFENPISIINENGRETFIKKVSFIIVNICIRICPRIWFSCSGFCLSYKWMCYWDDKLINEYDKKESRCNSYVIRNENPFCWESHEDINNNNDNNENIKCNGQLPPIAKENNNLFFQNSLCLLNLLNDKNPALIPYKYWFTFISLQIHKFLFYVILILFWKYTFNYMMRWVFTIGPLLQVFYLEFLAKIYFCDLILNFSFIYDMYSIFNWSETNNIIKKAFWVVISEINYFFWTSIIIFICYKKKLALDYLIIAGILIISLWKYVYWLMNSELDPIKFFSSSNYANLFTNPIFNYPFFLSGVFYGWINYVIQKGTTYKEAITQEKPCLLFPITVVNLFRQNKSFISSCVHYIIVILILILITIFSVWHSISMSLPNKSYYSFALKMISVIDIDITIILWHTILIWSYLKGENSLFKYLAHRNWGIANKIYFSVITVCSFVTYFIFYQSETRVETTLFSVIFYGWICGFVSFVIAAGVFVFFELSWKKIIQLIFNIYEGKYNTIRCWSNSSFILMRKENEVIE